MDKCERQQPVRCLSVFQWLFIWFAFYLEHLSLLNLERVIPPECSWVPFTLFPHSVFSMALSHFGCNKRSIHNGTQGVWMLDHILVLPWHTHMDSVVWYLIYPDIEPFVLLLLANFWFLVLLPQLGTIAHYPPSVPPPEMDSCWRCTCCPGIMQTHVA